MDTKDRCRWIAAHILPHEREIRGWLRRHVCTLSPADIDDLMQEAYARLWSLDFKHIQNGRSYLFTVTRNLLLEQARRARIIPMERMGEIDSLPIISEEPGPERRAHARQEFERLQRAVASLPARCRRAFELQKFDGLSQREVAEQMGITQKTVEKHLAKALARVIAAMTTEPEDEKGTSGGHRRHGTEWKSDR